MSCQEYLKMLLLLFETLQNIFSEQTPLFYVCVSMQKEQQQ